MRIAVAGIPGVGKTDLARALSRRLNLPFVTVPIEDIFNGEGGLRKKQYEALHRQIEAENAHPEGFVTDRPGMNYLAHWGFYFPPYDEENRRYVQMCLTRPYDLVAYISPGGALDGRYVEMETFLFNCVTQYKNKVILYQDSPEAMVEKVLRALNGGDLYWLGLGLA